MKRFVILLLALILLAGLLLALWFRAGDGQQPPTDSTVPVQSQEGQGGAKNSTANAGADAAKPGQGISPPDESRTTAGDSGQKSAGPDDEPERFSPAMTRLIPETRDETLRVGRLLQRCPNGFWSEDTIRQSVESQEALTGGKKWGVSIRGESVEFQDIGDYEAYLWNLHDQCEALQEKLDESSANDILLAAEAGNAYARYLYAMWPPEQNFEHTGAMLEYQERALDFTWRNIRAGEALGLLALGQSYGRSGQASLFTAQNRILSQVFLVAAAKCGIASTWLDAEVDTIIEQLDRPGLSSADLEKLNQNSDDLSVRYCR